MTSICDHAHVCRKYALKRGSASSSPDVHNGILQWDTGSVAGFVHIRLTPGSHGLASATCTMESRITNHVQNGGAELDAAAHWVHDVRPSWDVPHVVWANPSIHNPLSRYPSEVPDKHQACWQHDCRQTQEFTFALFDLMLHEVVLLQLSVIGAELYPIAPDNTPYIPQVLGYGEHLQQHQNH